MLYWCYVDVFLWIPRLETSLFLFVHLQRVFPQWPAVYYSYEVHSRPDPDAKPQGKVCVCLSGCVCFLYIYWCVYVFFAWARLCACVQIWIRDMRLEAQGQCICYYPPAHIRHLNSHQSWADWIVVRLLSCSATLVIFFKMSSSHCSSVLSCTKFLNVLPSALAQCFPSGLN